MRRVLACVCFVAAAVDLVAAVWSSFRVAGVSLAVASAAMGAWLLARAAAARAGCASSD